MPVIEILSDTFISLSADSLGIFFVIIASFSIFSCITLSDLTGDGDFKLVVADLGSGSYNMKLRVYKGTQMVSLVSFNALYSFF